MLAKMYQPDKYESFPSMDSNISVCKDTEQEEAFPEQMHQSQPTSVIQIVLRNQSTSSPEED